MPNTKGTRNSEAVFKRPDTSTWAYSLELGRDPETGKRRQRKRSGFRTKREAQDALRAEQVDRERGDHVEDSPTTVAEFLDGWLRGLPARELAPSTVDAYERAVRTHIKPHLGGVKVQDLTPQRIAGFLGDLRTNGRREGDEPLSAKTVANVRGVLSTALDDAATNGLLAVNPVSRVRTPRTAKTRQSKVKAWTQAELARFLDYVERLEDDHDEGVLQAVGRLYPLWLTLAVTGMRRGEALGLQWQDVEDGCLHVRRTRTSISGREVRGPTKTGLARRVQIDPTTLAVLQRWRERQEREAAAWAEVTGDTSAWNPEGWMFVLEDGRPVDPNAVSRWFTRACESAGLPGIGVHGLRHSHASLLLLGGEDFVTVARRLGHSEVSTTLNIYGHLLPAGAESAAMRAGEIVHERPRLRAV